MKQIRRGGNGGRGDAFAPRNGRGGLQETMYSQARTPPASLSFQNMPVPPSFDPNDPLSAIMAMQAMGLPPLPMMPPLTQAGSPSGYPQFGGQDVVPPHDPLRNPLRERCRDYDENFYCERGDACPYEHGTDRLVASTQDGRPSHSLKTMKLMSYRVRSKKFDPCESTSCLSYVERTRRNSGTSRQWIYER